MEASTELRKLSPGVIYQLGRILDVQDAWKKLMAIVPKIGMQSGDYQTPKYTVEHIMLIEQAGRNQNRPSAEIFLEEWGSSGRQRPDVSFLIYLLGKAELFRAADFITSLLKEPPLERPDIGPSAPVDVSYEALEKLVVKLPQEKLNGYHVPVNTDEINKKIDEMSVSSGSLPSLVGVDEQIAARRHSSDEQQNVSRECSRTTALGEQETVPVDHLERIRQIPLHLETSLTHINYAHLEHITDHFNETPQTAGGKKLGTGGFGSVLLEILTGLPPYDESREGHDLVTHVETMCEETGDIGILLDNKAGDWGKEYVAMIPQVSSLADKLYSVACSCLEDSRAKRPTIPVVVQRLEEILVIIA